MNEQLAKLRDWFDKLAPRERRMMSWLFAVVVMFVVFMAPVGVSLMVSSRRETNKALRDAIFSIKSARDEVRVRQAKRRAVMARYEIHAPPLAGFLEKAARDNKLDVPESQDRPEVPHGKKYVERTTVIRLRKTSMLQLAKTLEMIEQQHLPIAISRLNVRRRGGESDSYDVELGVSAFDRNETSKEPPPAPGGGGK
jgi:general secretion pathway protein M